MVRMATALALSVWLGLTAAGCTRTRAAEPAKESTPRAGSRTTAGADASSASRRESAIGSVVGPFELSDFQGKKWSSAELIGDAKLLVVAFVGVECPLVKLYAARLNDLRSEFGDRVAWGAIDSNQQDSLAEMSHFARTQRIEFPLLKDPGNRVADLFGAERTPEVFLLDRDGRVVYRGRIDDQYTYGLQRPKVEREYLREAITAALDGKTPNVAETEVVGCHIGRVLTPDADSPVTFANQIARIFQDRCVECHRPGEIGPFALTEYDEAVGWAEMIAEVVEQRRMPPWHANPEHGRFSNDARLTDDERRLILDWVAAGAPLGDPAQLPKPREFTEGWRIGEPDRVIYMDDKPTEIPGHGEVPYRYFVVDPGFTEDTWIQAAECRPGNRAVVHHIIVAVKPQGVGDRGAHGVESHWLAATAPGARPMVLPPGKAKFVPAGAKLVFQMHYTPNGTPQTDRSSIGLIFADPGSVKQIVATEAAANRRIRIAPGAEHHREEASYTFRRETDMLAMFPHMHLRGKAFRYTVKRKDGATEILLDVPRYDFNWQNSYIFAEPMRMHAGDELVCEAWYDNSEENLANPDSTAQVRWGDQTWEEMMIGYFDMSLAEQDLTNEDANPRTQEFLAKAAGSSIVAPDELRRLAGRALESNEAMQDFGRELAKLVPQADRACWTAVEERTLHVRVAVQRPELQQALRGAGHKVPVLGMRLPVYAARAERIVHDHLKNVAGFDMRFMSRELASSVHVPINRDGVRGTINFWSAEPSAFPPAAADLLERLARDMEAGKPVDSPSVPVDSPSVKK